MATAKTRAHYDDERALGEFAAACNLVTFEFENVPDGTAHYLADHVPVAPAPRALSIAQDRFLEKTFIAGLGIATAPFRNVANETDVLERLQVSVHRTDVRHRYAAPYSLRDLLCGHRPVRHQQGFEHQPPRCGCAQAARAHERDRFTQMSAGRRFRLGPSCMRAGAMTHVGVAEKATVVGFHWDW